MVLAWKSMCSCLTHGSWLPCQMVTGIEMSASRKPHGRKTSISSHLIASSPCLHVSRRNASKVAVRDGVFEEPSIAFGSLERLVDDLRILLESIDFFGEVLRCEVGGSCWVLLSQLELCALLRAPFLLSVWPFGPVLFGQGSTADEGNTAQASGNQRRTSGRIRTPGRNPDDRKG